MGIKSKQVQHEKYHRQVLLAIAAGADAIYCGLKIFSAQKAGFLKVVLTGLYVWGWLIQYYGLRWKGAFY